MRFIQTIEFQGTQERFEELLEQYRAGMAGDSLAKRATLCRDRDRPDTLVELVEFDSWDDAERNNQHPVTQRFAQDASDIFGDAVFRNLDVIGTYEV